MSRAALGVHPDAMGAGCGLQLVLGSVLRSCEALAVETLSFPSLFNWHPHLPKTLRNREVLNIFNTYGHEANKLEGRRRAMQVDGYFQYSLGYLPGLLPVHPDFQLADLVAGCMVWEGAWNQWNN